MTLKGVFDFRIPFAFNFSLGTEGNFVEDSRWSHLLKMCLFITMLKNRSVVFHGTWNKIQAPYCAHKTSCLPLPL